MPNEQDPRNIFVNQRQEYSERQTDTSNQTNSSYTGNSAPHNGTQTNPQSEYERRVEEMKRLAAKYEREGEGQLVKDIVNNVIEQKARGTLSNEQLIAFAKRVSPLLNSEQRSRLEGLLEQLLKI
ncbi:MAG: hypothetical protein J1F66_00690 [Clostridiales bacterium]|nr:hypothetical protein [Clostridiales bacterium]